MPAKGALPAAQHMHLHNPCDLFAGLPLATRPATTSECSLPVLFASIFSLMSDLNSPEKPRSEPSLGGSQPHSWSDVTLIEDITQESLHRSLSAQCRGEDVQSSSESEAEQPSPTEPLEQPPPSNIPAQAICVVKRFRMRSRSRCPNLPIAPASGQLSQTMHPASQTSLVSCLCPWCLVPAQAYLPQSPRQPGARHPRGRSTQPRGPRCPGTLSPTASRRLQRASGPGCLSLQARGACSQTSLHPLRGGLNTC